MDKKYQNYLLSDNWKWRRKFMLDMTGNKCQRCKSSYNLQIHHASYENIYSASILDLVVLCESCHETFHEIYWMEDLRNNTFIFVNGQEKFDRLQEMKRTLRERTEQREAQLRQIQETKERIFNK